MCLASKDPRPSGPRTPDPLGQVHYRPLPIGVPLQKETSPSLPSHPLFLEVSGTLELSPVPGPHPGGHRNTQSLTHATRSILPVLLGLNLRSSLCRANAFPNKKLPQHSLSSTAQVPGQPGTSYINSKIISLFTLASHAPIPFST